MRWKLKVDSVILGVAIRKKNAQELHMYFKMQLGLQTQEVSMQAWIIHWNLSSVVHCKLQGNDSPPSTSFFVSLKHIFLEW